jgi:anti-anti-sigma factor
MAALTIHSRLEDGIGILELSGALTLGPTLVNMRKTARQIVTSNSLRGFIVQLAAIQKIDSSGLGELTVVYSLTSLRRIPLRLVGANPDLKRMLELTRLDRVLPMCENIEAAKGELGNPPLKQASSTV